MPITPPQVRVPTTGPMPSALIAALTMSPSDPENSLATATTGPRGASSRVAVRLHAARQVPADDAAGQLLHDQLGGVAAAVLADVHDQPLAGDFDPQVAVDLGPAGRLHVGDVQIAEPSAGLLVDVRPPVRDPRVVAQRLLVRDRDDDDVPQVAAAGRRDGQLDRLARRADEQRAGPGHGVDRVAVDGKDRVPGPDRDAGRGQRGAGARVGGLGRQDAVDAPTRRRRHGRCRRRAAPAGACRRIRRAG